jgi:cell wall-associated NlpC family hydrolase
MAWPKPRARQSRWLNVTRVVLLIVATAFLAVSVPAATLAKDEATTVHLRGPIGGDDTWDEVVGADMPPPTPEPTPESTPEPPPAAPAPPPVGDIIVQFAMAYYGYPYIWAANGPYGFDCSGFTEFVMLNTLGIDIGHAVAGQPYAGYWVDYGYWLPGDLIFFQNTYDVGISHVGIYIGDGLFIHAENPGTGVTISSVYSAYYGAHYWGATRIA